MYTYETVFITLPTLTEDEERAVVGTFAQVVTDGGGQFTANERLGRRRLAFSIRRFDDGVYTRFLYDSEPAVPKELERRIRISDKVLRYLTVRLEPDWAVAAKEQAVRDALTRAQAAEAAEAAEAARVATALEPEPLAPDEEEEVDEDEEDQDPEDDATWARSGPAGEGTP